MKKLSPKAIIFDLGSTLVDYPVNNWDEVSRECSLVGRQHLCDSGCNLPDEQEFLARFEEVRVELREVATTTHKEWTVVRAAEILLNKLGVTSPNGFAEQFFDAFYGTFEKHLYIYDDTIEVLTRLKKRFAKVGLISNTIFPEKTHFHEFERFGLKHFFDFTVFSSTFGLRKPHPIIFLEASRLAETNPPDCVYIGDRFLEDVQGSQGAGMSAILKIVPDREYPSDMPASLRKISCLSDLSDHLDI